MKKLLLLFSFILTMFVANSQTYVKDSISQFRLPLSTGSFIFDKGAGNIWQILESAEPTDSLVSVNRRLANKDTLELSWRNDISDSLATIDIPTFAELLTDNNNAGDTTITGLRGFGNGTIESGGLGIANYGGVVNGMGIANYGGVVNGTGIATTNGVASGLGLQFATTSGSTSNSGSISMVTQLSYALECDNSIALSVRDTLIGINANPTFISLAGWHNKLTQTAEGNYTRQSILLASDSSNVTNSDNFVGINLQNKTYENLDNTTVIDRELLLPGVVSSTAPASATDTGTKGEIRITADYIYVCIDTDTWVRSALSTW